MTALLPRRRRRLEFLPCSRWRLPAWLRMTLPVPVILNRLATDFLVLIPLGRRINFYFNCKRARTIRSGGTRRKRDFCGFGFTCPKPAKQARIIRPYGVLTPAAGGLAGLVTSIGAPALIWASTASVRSLAPPLLYTMTDVPLAVSAAESRIRS